MTALSPRDRRALGGGGLIVAVLLVYLLWPDSEPGAEAGSEPLAQPVVAAAAPAPLPVPAPAPLHAADLGQLRLFGIMGRGAVIAGADGTQRYVPLGRDVAPACGCRLEVRHAPFSPRRGANPAGLRRRRAAASPGARQALRRRRRSGAAPIAPANIARLAPRMAAGG